MNIQILKLQFLEDFMRISNEDIINKLNNLLKKEKSKLYKSNLQQLTNDELSKKIEKSEEDIKSGNVYTQSEVEEYFKNKLQK
ncbi:MAG: hypothetical protein A2033_07780 [Bacteroidetes bacterium GWA2_31_9]|nr:MAG: hypothetical protein A2033_07780 [Bacteroidetes bacterium GWA2_31_9]